MSPAGKCKQGHKAEDYADFLKVLDRKAPEDKALRITAGNYSAHKAPAVKSYPKEKTGRFAGHFIKT
jgi:hypothetical protein